MLAGATPVGAAPGPLAQVVNPPTGDNTGNQSTTPDPVIIIQQVATTPQNVTVGSTFTLTLSLKNATKRTAENVYVALGQATGAASAAGGSSGLVVVGTGNVQFVGTLNSNATSKVTFQITADPSGAAGTYSIPVTVSYEYGGSRASLEQMIGLVLNRDATFSVVTAEVPEGAMIGEPFDVTIEAANQSRFTVGSVALSLEASGAEIVDDTVQVGSLEAGASDFLDATVTPRESGVLELVFVVSYRDDLDQPKEYRETFKVVVADLAEAPEEPGEGAEEPEEERGFFERFFLSLLGLGG